MNNAVTLLWKGMLAIFVSVLIIYLIVKLFSAKKIIADFKQNLALRNKNTQPKNDGDNTVSEIDGRKDDNV